MSTGQGPGQDPEHHRHGNGRVDVAPAQVHSGAGGRRTAVLKLVVVVETFEGMPMAWSMARTLTAPEPMPSNPDSAPAPNINPKPAGTRCTKYGLGPLRDGYTPFMPKRVANGSG